MHVCLSPEAATELKRFKDLDRDVGIALEASIEMLARDPNPAELLDGFSIQHVIALYRRGIRVSRLKYENHFHGVRVLFLPISSRDCVFVTGIHGRGDLGLGGSYDFFREPLVRATVLEGEGEPVQDLVGSALPIPRIEGLPETPSSPVHWVTVWPQNDQQKKASIQESIRNQYLLAAISGRISKIRGYRVFRNMDQAELASRAGMTQPEISRAERPGQVNRMKGATLKRIADALQVRIDELF